MIINKYLKLKYLFINMKILSIDVGMKNLAYCYINYTSIDNYIIEKWDVINLCQKDIFKCNGFSKKGKCNKLAKFKKRNEYYCKIHAKNKKYKIPHEKFKLNKLKKYKINELKTLAYDYNISLNVLAKKKECYETILSDLSNNYFDYIKKFNTNDKNLVEYGRTMKIEFEKIFNNEYSNMDLVLIENQIGPLALRMKTLQGMIMQHFIEKKIPRILEISASNKLKDFLGKKKTTYSERKKASIEITHNLLLNTNCINCWHEFYNKHKKKDDLADCFLQAKWHLKTLN